MDDSSRRAIIDLIREGLYAADVFEVDSQAVASSFGSQDAELEAAVIAGLTDDCNCQDDAKSIIEQLSRGIKAFFSGATELDDPGRWGLYYVAQHIARKDGTGCLENVDPELDGSAAYLADYDDKLSDIGVQWPIGMADAALRGVPQVGNLVGISCYPDGGRPVDFLPTLGYVTQEECKASLELVADVVQLPRGLGGLLSLFTMCVRNGHDLIICVSDWFPQASP